MWISFGVTWGKAAQGPYAIKAALDNLYAYSISSANDINKNYFYDSEIKPKNFPDMLNQVEAKMKSVLKTNRPLVFGGDHLVTYAILKSLEKKPAVVISFDAHFDLMDEENNNKFTHATWARRALEEKLAKKILFIGVRDCAEEEMKYAKSTGMKFFTSADVKNNIRAIKEELRKIKGDVYVTIDIDVLDPAQAPAVGTPVPFGLDVAEVLGLLKCLNPIALDVTEICTEPKPNDITAAAAAFILREWLCSQK